MRAALAQARLAARRKEVPVGAVVVRNGRVIARAGNEIVRRRDPSAHAEVLAIQRAAGNLGNERLNGCVLYATLEPCPMCAFAAILARVDEVVFGARDPKAGAAGSAVRLLGSHKFNHRPRVRGPLGPKECGDILRRFFRSKR